MGHNTTGPPRAAPWWAMLHMHRVTDDQDRRRQQTPMTVTSQALYTMCRRVSNK